MRSLVHPRQLTLFLFALPFLLSAGPLLATTRTWSGASINDPNPSNRNNFWTTAANWAGNVSPLPGDDLVFPTGSPQTASLNTFAAGTSFGKITIGTHVLTGSSIVLTAGLDATGGTIALGGIKIANQQIFTVSNANSSVVITSPIDTNGQTLLVDDTGTIVFAGPVSGSGNLLKRHIGTGTAVLAGANTVSACASFGGTLVVAGSQPNTFTRVQIDGVLAGNGTTGAVEVLASATGFIPVVAPGNNGPAVLNTGAVQFLDNPSVGTALLSIDLNGTNVGSGYDQLNVTGTVNLGTLARLNVAIGAGFTPIPGDTFVIVRNDGTDAISGVFKDLPEGSLFGIGG